MVHTDIFQVTEFDFHFFRNSSILISNTDGAVFLKRKMIFSIMSLRGIHSYPRCTDHSLILEAETFSYNSTVVTHCTLTCILIIPIV